MTTDPDFPDYPGPSGPNWRFIVAILISAGLWFALILTGRALWNR